MCQPKLTLREVDSARRCGGWRRVKPVEAACAGGHASPLWGADHEGRRWRFHLLAVTTTSPRVRYRLRRGRPRNVWVTDRRLWRRLDLKSRRLGYRFDREGRRLGYRFSHR